MAAVVTVTLNPALDITAEVEELVPYRKLRGRLVGLDPGGGGVNVARVLRRFGVPALAVAPLGGASGDALMADLEREGVTVHRVGTDVDTRRSVTLWVRTTREHFASSSMARRSTSRSGGRAWTPSPGPSARRSWC